MSGFCDVCDRPLLEGQRCDARHCSPRCRQRAYRRRLRELNREALLASWAATGAVRLRPDGTVEFGGGRS